MPVHREGATFEVRIELSAEFDDDYEGDDDGGAWLRRWLDETRPQVVTAVLRALAADRRFKVVPTSRGRSPDDAFEVSVALDTRSQKG